MKAFFMFGVLIQGVHQSCQSETESSVLLQIKPFQNRHRKHVLSAKRKLGAGGERNLSSYMQNRFKANFTPSCVTFSPSLITAQWVHIKLYVFKIITLAFETEGQVFCWGKLKQIHWLNAVKSACNNWSSGTGSFFYKRKYIWKTWKISMAENFLHASLVI